MHYLIDESVSDLTPYPEIPIIYPLPKPRE